MQGVVEEQVGQMGEEKGEERAGKEEEVEKGEEGMKG